MPESLGGNAPILEGFAGMPVHPQYEHGPPRGSFEWLAQALERHAAAEADALEQYARIATTSGDPVITLVMRLILEDEERHHGLLRRMEATLRDALNWTHSPNSLPATATPPEPVSGELASVARSLVAEEHTGARAMRELASREKGIDAGLHSLLLEMMAMDSDKHARLLQFVQHRLEARAQTR
jgi:rubrerythrin